MDFLQSLALLGRRWVFFVAALLLAAIVTAGIFYTVKPQYQAPSDLLVVPPAIPTTQTAGNFVNDYGNLNTVASIVSYRENSQQVATQLKAIGIDNYAVTTDPTGAVPELIVTVTASSPLLAFSQDKWLTQDVGSYLLHMQSGANPDTFVSARLLAGAARATRDDKSRIRVVVAAGGVLVFLAVSLTFLYDSLMRRRKQSPERERKASEPRLDEPNLESETPRTADGRVSNRAAAQYGRRTGAESVSRSVASSSLASTSAYLREDS